MESHEAERIARAIAQEHDELRERTDGLRASLERWRREGHGRDELRAQVAAFRAHLSKHFELEERNGFLRGVDDRTTRTQREAEGLLAEHRELERRAARLIGDLAEPDAEPEATAVTLEELLRDLRAHELAENALFQRATYSDWGGGD